MALSLALYKPAGVPIAKSVTTGPLGGFESGAGLAEKKNTQDSTFEATVVSKANHHYPLCAPSSLVILYAVPLQPRATRNQPNDADKQFTVNQQWTPTPSSSTAIVSTIPPSWPPSTVRT